MVSSFWSKVDQSWPKLDLRWPFGNLCRDINVIPSWFRVIPNQWCVLWFNLAGRHHWPQHQAIHYSRRYPSCRYLMTSKWPRMTFHVNVETFKYGLPSKKYFQANRSKIIQSMNMNGRMEAWSHIGKKPTKCVGVSIIYVGDSNYLQKTTFSYCKYYYMSAHF